MVEKRGVQKPGFEVGRRDPNCGEPGKGDDIRDLVAVLSVSGPKYFFFGISDREQSSSLSLSLSLSLSFQQQSLSGETMDPTLVPSTWFESQFQICVYEHAILRIYISFFHQLVSEPIA